MSILGFARNIGRNLFDRDDLAAERIKEMLEIKLGGYKDLEVAFDDGVVTLRGACISQAYREQSILLAGNVKGVEKVVADELTVPAPPPKADAPVAAEPAAEGVVTDVAEAAPQEEKVEFYDIQSGDSLSAIAKRFYGDAMQYPRIFAANRAVIEDPNKIYPGQKIRIPIA